ncbi:MAG TPA: hypothetical protein PLP29_20240, partial [Candidatus Ozemobacteraceae bacterium]|nr:hypothetical protein [Candidatus Ozemobacteraceae bacterium]
MKRIVLTLALAWLSTGSCMAAGEPVWPEEQPIATEAAGPVDLQLKPGAPTAGSFSVEIQSRTAIRMLLVPKSTLMGQIDIAGSFSLESAPEGRAIQSFDVLTASMAYYSPGAPNRDI